ncbi:MAG: hypothetical protein Q8L34_05195 [Candidatus Woesearchaeota archaeon]|nr:hypothetical protein [Candidatus Woesearchaeota archaeon]
MTLDTLVIETIPVAFSDFRGDISNLFTPDSLARFFGDTPIAHVAAYTSQKDAVRGNHYHPFVEAIFLVSGSYELTVQNTRELTKPEKHIIRPAQLVVFPPHFAHALRHLDFSLAVAFSAGQKTGDTTKTVIPYTLL